MSKNKKIKIIFSYLTQPCVLSMSRYKVADFIQKLYLILYLYKCNRLKIGYILIHIYKYLYHWLDKGLV